MDSVLPPVTLDELSVLSRRAATVIERLRERVFAPGTQKQLDFSMSFKLDKRWQLTFDASNLNNEKYYVYMGDKSRNAQHEQYGRTFKIGLKASIFQ